MVSETLIRLGPFVVPVLLVILAVLLGLVVWLLTPRPVFDRKTGKLRRMVTPWRAGIAVVILLFLGLQLAPLVLS